MTVKVPAGVDTGSQLRLQGEGEPGESGGPPGDLFVVIHVKDHEFFAREGDDLVCQIPVSFVQAALGDSFMIPVLGNDDGYELVVPKGTQPGDVIRVKGQGMPSLRHARTRGDLFVKMVVKIPEKLNQQQREILEAYAETEGIELSEKKKREKHFWNRTKK